MIDPNYNPEHDRMLREVKEGEEAALYDNNKTYDKMIADSDNYYKAQIDASKQWAETQKQNQQAQTDFAIEQINQQKEQTQKDYQKEQSGAYVDWQKQNNRYGAEAEMMAAQGMTNTGYSESSEVAKYVAYQNRVATARESYNRAVLNYDNAIKDARLQNNSALAEIAYQALQDQLTLSLQGFQYKNQLILDKANKKAEIEDRYHARYQDVLDEIYRDKAFAEQQRQYNETLAEQKRQHDAAIAAQNAQLALEREKFAWQKSQATSSGGGSGGSINKGSGGSSGGSSKVKGAKAAGKDSSSIRGTGKKNSSKDLPVDTKSLVNAGLAGASASKIAAEIAAGRLVESVVNGKLTYKRVFNGTTAKTTTTGYTSGLFSNKQPAFKLLSK
jgi:hypothetical protein